MRLPALIALAALVGLAACDSAKVSELTGAKPATTQIAAACPPAATVAPACPPAQPAMAPEAAKPAAAPAASPPAAQVVPAVHRAQSHAKARAWAQRHRVKAARHAVVVRRHHAAQPPVRHFAYAGGYTGDETFIERRDDRRHAHPPAYAHPDEAYGQQGRRYERRDEGYAQDRYGYERRDSGHAPYVDERRDHGRDAYRYERREGSVERSESSSSYERRDGGYSSGSVSGGGYVSGGSYGDDCNCRPQAAGRDRQGFLTWPGKR